MKTILERMGKIQVVFLFFVFSIFSAVFFVHADILGGGTINTTPEKTTFYSGTVSALNPRMIINANGNIGVGTSRSDARFSINGPTTSYPNARALRVDANGESPFKDQVMIVGNNSFPYGVAFVGAGHHRGGLYAQNIEGVSTGYIGLWARNYGTIFMDAGSVGIGVAQPKEALEVKGNVKVSGNIISDGDICIGNCVTEISAQSAETETPADPYEGMMAEDTLDTVSGSSEESISFDSYSSYPSYVSEQIPQNIQNTPEVSSLPTDVPLPIEPVLETPIQESAPEISTAPSESIQEPVLEAPAPAPETISESVSEPAPQEVAPIPEAPSAPSE